MEVGIGFLSGANMCPEAQPEANNNVQLQIIGFIFMSGTKHSRFSFPVLEINFCPYIAGC